jgi:hypothetical protein
MRALLVLVLGVAGCAHRPAIGLATPDPTAPVCGPARSAPKRVAVLASGMMNEVFRDAGRSGPPDAYGVGLDGSYTWATVPGGPLVETCDAPTRCYAGTVSMLTRANAGALGIHGSYALAEVVLNCDGQVASPFNAITQLRRIDGTPAWPARLDDQLRELVAAQRALQREAEQALAAPLRESLTGAVGSHVPFFTFSGGRLRVRVRTRVTVEEHNNACGQQTTAANRCRALSAIKGYELSTTWELAGSGAPRLLEKSSPVVIDRSFPALP